MITKIGVIKQGELLENHISSDNQQPSKDRNIFEGSTTNERVLACNDEDSNLNTSALPGINGNSFQIIVNKNDFFSDDIV